MIHTPTLFVLGAGASKPYGQPLGSELRTMVCDAQNEDNPAARGVAQNGAFGFTHADIRHVALTFLRSGVRSIDEFLGRFPHMVDVGKALIAAIICAKEHPDEIFSEQNPDHWYRILWNALIDGTTQGQELRQNSVRFITFNYDRSLEFFLHESTKATYGYNDSSSYALWSPLEVMHVYGSVGEFNFADGGNINRTRPYSPEIKPRELGAAAGGINIMPEGRDDAPQFQMARRWFDWAQHVYILGFGFDRLNCDRLNFESVLQHNRGFEKPPPSINASVLGLTPAEVIRAQRCLLGNEGNWTVHNAKNAMTLRLAGLPD